MYSSRSQFLLHLAVRIKKLTQYLLTLYTCEDMRKAVLIRIYEDMCTVRALRGLNAVLLAVTQQI